MGYYMRFITADDRDLTADGLRDGLRAADERYRLRVNEQAARPSAEILLGAELCGEFEINKPGDELFEEEVEELKESLEDAEEGDLQRVTALLEGAKAIVAVQVLGQDRETEEALARLDPLWESLFESRDGLLQADGEGYYDRTGLILSVE